MAVDNFVVYCNRMVLTFAGYSIVDNEIVVAVEAHDDAQEVDDGSSLVRDEAADEIASDIDLVAN